MSEFKLPDVGEGLTEAEIVSWRVQEGDTVAINDIVVEIETAKSLVELPSPYAGTVTALLVAEGDTVPVGVPIIAIGDPVGARPVTAAPEEVAQQPSSETPRSSAPRQPSRGVDLSDMDLSNPAASGGGEGESLVGRNKADRGPVRRPRKGSASPATESAAATQMQLQGAFSQGGAQSDDVVESDEPAVPAREAPAPVVPDAFVPAQALTGERARTLAKPPVRKLARDLGVDLASLAPTGPHGTVSRDDVQAAASRASAGADGEPAVRTSYEPVAGAAGPHDVPAGREVREPIRGVRRMMGQAMVRSAFSAPHVTEWITVDVTRTTELVERLRGHREFRDVKVSPLLMLARAAVLAVRRTPEINSTWDEQAQEVVYKSYVNLGIAAATPRGLVVPNVKDADRLSLRELAEALAALTATAREGRTQPAEMSGGTFTITNVGVFGVDAGTPIINPGESAILCFGATRRQPWVVGTGADERLEIRDVCTLALSFDHRHVDGQAGSRFLADVASVMEDPANALLL
ncbi:pyruvate dehydrogenase E2 component (dihydrolipoamide acetyltransferase) [Nocardioides scoriae]|uniref:Dihydrolipoamide acetyltransferase component of pyruvate dehydrogenase complex n=1 Tax=Nocardioides scoriae TaxID=642780 RepID=A0A1H1WCL5_9ACTN|nr:dihydrolipoamide acetyltransferase family protein [Nocardioides scoriae]SDS94997.1 pyruvate dehydrogenase E2 component (dihydrolipoamide acetyltransferase) [Nocardioides scoriae]